MKKLRQDSVAANLPPYLRDAVDEMFFSGTTYKAVQERVAEDGITWSLTSIAQYYHNHVQPLMATRRKDIAAKLNKMDASDLDEATLQAVRSTVFDLATSPGSDPKTLKTLFGIVQSYAKGKMESTRLQLDIDKWQTMAAQGRTAPLVMAGPPGLTDVVRTFYAVAGPLPFELRLKELPDCKGEFEVPAGCVQAFPLKHRVPCCGYAFTLPRAGKFDPQRAKAAGIPVRYWSTLQSGQPVGGFLPSQVLGPPRRGLKVVYATDTRRCAAVRRATQDADLLLMDSTYADDADLPKAKLYGHSTCRETGVLAAEANVCRLWLTHYSAAVTDLAPGLAAAQQAFPTAAAGVDGMRLTLNFDPD